MGSALNNVENIQKPKFHSIWRTITLINNGYLTSFFLFTLIEMVDISRLIPGHGTTISKQLYTSAQIA